MSLAGAVFKARFARLEKPDMKFKLPLKVTKFIKIIEGQLKQKRAVREHAISLRKLVAEAGLQYSDLAQIYENSQESRQILDFSRRAERALKTAPTNCPHPQLSNNVDHSKIHPQTPEI